MVSRVNKPIDSKEIHLKTPLMVALDVDDLYSVRTLVDQLQDVAGCFKVGPRLVYRFGEKLVQDLAERAPVFVDCKFFDIQSTMEASVRAAFEAGATFVTIHAMCGRETLLRMAEIEDELNQQRPFKILNVTILTSWEEKSFPKIFVQQPVQDHVLQLVEHVTEAGMNGIVCSPMELDILRDRGLFLVTPGVRLKSDEKSDQKRVLLPEEAINKGARAFVVGRPIIGAKNPKEAALAYVIQ